MAAIPPIVLTTDFGLTDAYVGVMKGVILNINPRATLIDLTHDIQPQNLAQASFVLGVNYPYFPPDTIHVAVVDPGVGTPRRALLLVTPEARFLAPDNGLLSHVLKGYRAAAPDPLKPAPAPEYESAPAPGLVPVPVPPGLAAYRLTNPRYWRHPVSNTFHGRDVFAPAAAHLSRGISPQRLGLPVTRLLWQPPPEPAARGNALLGEVIYADRFGNLVTNISAGRLPAGRRNAAPLIVEIGRRRISGLSRTFHDPAAAAAAGAGVDVDVDAAGAPDPARPDAPALLALIGSNGYLELAVRDGSAAQTLGLGAGAPVRVVGLA